MDDEQQEVSYRYENTPTHLQHRISCAKCGMCNHKGKPSVSRFSAYCDSHLRNEWKVDRKGFFDGLKMKYLWGMNQLMKPIKGFRLGSLLGRSK
jgi:hypothetical protein